jgi:hypothetical protein
LTDAAIAIMRCCELFEIRATAYYNIDWDDEFGEEVDEEGRLELISGQKIPFEIAKRNGFDAIGIVAINSKGNQMEILQEELA